MRPREILKEMSKCKGIVSQIAGIYLEVNEYQQSLYLAEIAHQIETVPEATKKIWSPELINEIKKYGNKS